MGSAVFTLNDDGSGATKEVTLENVSYTLGHALMWDSSGVGDLAVTIGMTGRADADSMNTANLLTSWQWREMRGKLSLPHGEYLNARILSARKSPGVWFGHGELSMTAEWRPDGGGEHLSTIGGYVLVEPKLSVNPPSMRRGVYHLHHGVYPAIQSLGYQMSTINLSAMVSGKLDGAIVQSLSEPPEGLLEWLEQEEEDSFIPVVRRLTDMAKPSSSDKAQINNVFVVDGSIDFDAGKGMWSFSASFMAPPRKAGDPT